MFVEQLANHLRLACS